MTTVDVVEEEEAEEAEEEKKEEEEEKEEMVRLMSRYESTSPHLISYLFLLSSFLLPSFLFFPLLLSGERKRE